jgi:hypothetical protein
MKRFQQYYKFKLWEKLKEADITFKHENAATLLIENPCKISGKTTAHIVYSNTVKPFSVQSSQNIEILSTGLFALETSSLLFRPDFYIFVFGEKLDAIHFVVIPYTEFIQKLETQNRYPIFDKKLKLRFWLLPGNRLFETIDIGAEGEWYFLTGNGAMASETAMDFSGFLNCWEKLKQNK